MSAQIVLIEDEPDLLELLEYQLQSEGFECVGFLSTTNVEKFLEEEDVDLMIVDRNLSGVEGSEFIKNLRDKGYQIPVIFLSAKDSDSDIEEGFLRGGDDYITKPYKKNELLLRIKAILKRTKSQDDHKIKYKDIVLDLKQRKVFVHSNEISLTKLEFNLLHEFIKNKNRVLDRDYLLDHVWRDENFNQEKTVNVAINRLKKKIDPLKKREYIKSIWGVGYKFC